MAQLPLLSGWFGVNQGPPPASPPDDEIKAKIRAMVAAGKSDDEIRKALEPRGVLDKAGAIATGSVKGLIADPLQLPAIKEAAQTLPDIGRRIVSPHETSFMGVPIGTVTDIAKGSGTALAQLGALPYTLGRSIGDALPVALGGKPGVKGSSALASVDAAAGTEDPYEAWPRRIGNIVALALAPRLIRGAKAGGAGGATKIAPWGGEATPVSAPTATTPVTGNPALRGIATVPPAAGRPIVTAPWMRMNVPNMGPRRPPGAAVATPSAPPTPAPGLGGGEPLGLPGPSPRTTPPPGARLVRNPPNPIVEAARQAVEEAQATHPTGAVELPPDRRSPTVQPPVSHPSEAQVKALVKAAAERKAKEAAARAAQAAKATSTTPPAGAGTGTSTVPSTTSVPSTIQRLEETLRDQRGEIDLTGKKGIEPQQATNITVEDKANLEAWYKFKQLHEAGKLTPAQMRQWAEVHNKVKDLKPNGPVEISPYRFEGLPPDEPPLTPYTLPDGTRVMLSTSATKGAKRTTFQLKGGKVVEAIRDDSGAAGDTTGGRLVPAGGEPRGPAAMPTAAEIAGGEADAFLSDWAKGGKLRAKLLNQKLTPEVRAAIETKLGERPGELPELRKALGLSATLEKAAAPPPGATPVQPGFQPGKTVSLPEMVAKYGKERAAQRMGMKVSELEARIEAGGDPGKLEAILRQKEGAAETNRRLGTAGPSTGRLPDSAVDRIRAAAAKETAAGGLTDKTKALADRIHAERPDEPKLYSGIDPAALWKIAKKHPAIIGAATGGTLGALAGSGGNDNEKIGGAVLGAGGGALLGASLANPSRAFEHALNITANSMLSGGAIAKNIVTLGGGTVRSAIENQTPAQGRLGALKQVISPSKIGANRRAYWQGTKNANPHTNPLVNAPSRTPAKWQRLVLPAHIIGGIDEMGTQAFRRAGMSQRNIERNLLTSHKNIIRGGLQRDLEKFPLRPGELDDKDLDALARIMVRFQRVPTNIINEGGKEFTHLRKHPFTARSAYNAAQAGASYWAGKKAKESPRNRLLALIALAAAGPNTALSTLAMAGGFGPQSIRALGGLTPVPEFEPPLTLKALGRNLGIPPAAYTQYQHLAENK